MVEDKVVLNFSIISVHVIALGGGVLSDLSAFVSSLIKRGIKFINIPSTLLSQVDASIGGKTALNYLKTKRENRLKTKKI